MIDRRLRRAAALKPGPLPRWPLAPHLRPIDRPIPPDSAAVPRLILPLILLAAAIMVASPAAAFDVKSGVLRSDTEAAVSCPHLCQFYGGWKRDGFVARDRRSTCSCQSGPLGKADEANAGPVPIVASTAWRCVSACAPYGGWAQSWRKLEDQMVCRCKEPLTVSKEPSP